MFNFKKIFDVAKRSICAALSAVMVLNMFSACAADEIRTYKVVLVGDTKSGKTALCERITRSTFPENNEETIGASFYSKEYHYQDESITRKIQFWDIGGKERYHSILSMYVKGADLVLLTVPYDKPYDEVDEYLNYWADQLNNAATPCNVKIVLTKNEPNLPGYNSSLKGQIEAYILKHNKNLKKLFAFEEEVIETSAKNNDGIDELEDYIVNYLTQREKKLPANGAATLSKTEQAADIVVSDDGADGLPEKGNNKKWIIGGGIGAGALLIPAAAILIHKFCHKTPAPKKLA